LNIKNASISDNEMKPLFTKVSMHGIRLTNAGLSMASYMVRQWRRAAEMKGAPFEKEQLLWVVVVLSGR
jgi:hypothetical protein